MRCTSSLARLIPYAISGTGIVGLVLAALNSTALVMAPLHVAVLSHALVIDSALMAIGIGAGSIELWLIVTYVLFSIPFIILAETLPRFSSTRRWPKAVATWLVLLGFLTILALILGAVGGVVE